MSSSVVYCHSSFGFILCIFDECFHIDKDVVNFNCFQSGMANAFDRLWAQMSNDLVYINDILLYFHCSIFFLFFFSRMLKSKKFVCARLKIKHSPHEPHTTWRAVIFLV